MTTVPMTESLCQAGSSGLAKAPRPTGASQSVTIPGAHFRRVLGNVPTSVAVVAGIGPDGQPVGLAIGTFTSVSMDPPLVAFCPGESSTSWPKIRMAKRFCVNVLAAGQEDVCAAFASKQPDKFSGLSWTAAGNGAPRLESVVAWVECDLEAEYQAGDHSIAVGRVTHLETGTGEMPLVFLGGRYLSVD
ncbi:flavin reductase family protein [Streptosporangium sp. NPDC049644]|uniref:flavin reductase family protein n=1 Tax=Streptosporangium sp. NPDC049644 TaxID=3155507 RepID=UPI00341BD8DA